jgi:hypothetical protein
MIQCLCNFVWFFDSLILWFFDSLIFWFFGFLIDWSIYRFIDSSIRRSVIWLFGRLTCQTMIITSVQSGRRRFRPNKTRHITSNKAMQEQISRWWTHRTNGGESAIKLFSLSSQRTSSCPFQDPDGSHWSPEHRMPALSREAAKHRCFRNPISLPTMPRSLPAVSLHAFGQFVEDKDCASLLFRVQTIEWSSVYSWCEEPCWMLSRLVLWFSGSSPMTTRCPRCWAHVRSFLFSSCYQISCDSWKASVQFLPREIGERFGQENWVAALPFAIQVIIELRSIGMRRKAKRARSVAWQLQLCELPKPSETER